MHAAGVRTNRLGCPGAPPSRAGLAVGVSAEAGTGAELEGNLLGSPHGGRELQAGNDLFRKELRKAKRVSSGLRQVLGELLQSALVTNRFNLWELEPVLC